MSKKFQDKVVLITGGNSGIGRATSLAFARQGAKLVIAARRAQEGIETVNHISELGGEVIFVETDVTKNDQVENLVAKTLSTYGALDICFNNAGYGGMMVPCAEFEEEIWDNTIDVNLKGVWLCMKHQIKAMLENGGGAIINNASAAGLNGGPFTGVAYCASKHGVVGLTKAVAAEYAAQNIRVNCICPGVVDTDMSNDSFEGAVKNHPVANKHPIGRVGLPEEIANTVLFLGSDDCPFIIGAAIPVDGGLTLDT